MVHENGIILDVNQAFASILGYSHTTDLVGRNAFEVTRFAPDSLQRVIEHQRLGSTEPYDVELIQPDGTIVPAETCGIEARYLGRQVRIAFMRDITERKRAEQALRRSEARFRQLFDGAADAIFIHDAHGKFVDVNRVACSSLGYERKELLGLRVL